MTTTRRSPERKPLGGPRSLIAGRVRNLFAVSMIGFLGLTARLAYLQIYQHEHYSVAAQKFRSTEKKILPHRGGILDRNLTYLALDEPAFLLTVDPNMWYAKPDPKAPRSTPEDRKAYCYSLLQREVPGVVEELRAKPFTVKGKHIQPQDFRNIPAEVAERIRKGNAVGLSLRPMARRVIVDGTLAPQIIGLTNSEGEGRQGLESTLNKQLAGKSGKVVAVFDGKRGGSSTVFNRIPLTTRSEQPAINGVDYVLTLDATIQKNTQQALAAACVNHRAESGTAVVIQPRTGEILAMASWPTFDLNRNSEASDLARQNQTVASPYEPGSTLKAVTVAAAMEEGLVSTGTEFFCPGAMKIGNKTIHCASHGGKSAHGQETLSDVIRNSCNVATADCAFRLNGERLTSYLKKFGFAKTTGGGFPGESAGQLSSFTSWSKVRLANIGFGQGISATSLQMAAAYGTFATGEYHAPHIIRGTKDPDGTQLRSQVIPLTQRAISERTARSMRAMLGQVIERGTGRLARLHGYTAGGKTGTAQLAERIGNTKKWRYGKKYVASFVGIAPLNDPKVVVLVSIRDPKGKEHFGGDVAAPAFRTIAQSALQHLHVPQDRPEPVMSPRPTETSHGFSELW